MKLSDEERFWSKVNTNGPVFEGEPCWLWTASTNKSGGQFGLRGRIRQASQVALELSGVAVPPHLQVGHRCRNKLCVNPAHLQQVTRSEREQNRDGANRNNRSSGVRGVSRERDRWKAQVKLNGVNHWGGYYDTVDEAEQAVIALRLELHINNLKDRES